VIGNSGYTGDWNDLGGLPQNDAIDVAQKLCQLGFDVTLGYDLTLDKFKDALTLFKQQQLVSGTELFYYSGHGIQVNDANYLVPLAVGADELSSKGIRLEDVYSSLDDTSLGHQSLMKIIILDACRDFKAGSKKGFSRPDNAPENTIVAYSTAPDSASSSVGGNGQNSLYTQHVLDYLGEPGLTLEALFNLVRNAVYEASHHYQTPWESNSAFTSFQFEPPLKIQDATWQAPNPDDLVIVTLNGTPVIETWRGQGADTKWVSISKYLHPGPNSFTVQVYNDKTTVGGQPLWWPGAKREGWRYTLNTKIEGTDSGSWSESQDVPDEAHWGTLFEVLHGRVLVDPVTGQVRMEDVIKVPH
jgi:hypothetical protein